MPQTVLIVDDHAGFRRAARAILEEEGYDVIAESATGTEAFEAVERFRPTLVLLDIGMPGMDGYEVARRLRRDPATRRSWIVAVTARGDPDEAFKAGCDQLLLKPLLIDDVLLCVEAALVRSNPLEALEREELKAPPFEA